MSMQYAAAAIPDSAVPRAREPFLQHVLDTYQGECNKVASIWLSFSPKMLHFRPHPKSSSVAQIMEHQLLSERRFFGEFLGSPEPAPALVLPAERSPAAMTQRLVELALPRFDHLAAQDLAWWQHRVSFFDVERERIWVFWRRILHTAHHRTQLTVYQRLLEMPVLPTYGPTADVSWDGADPTLTVEAAGRP